MKSIVPLERRLEELAEWARRPSHRPIDLAATPEEINRAGEIIIRADLGQDPSPDDIAFLEELMARPTSEQEIDHSQPQCVCCGQQPAWPRDGSQPYCEPCWKANLGNAYDWP